LETNRELVDPTLYNFLAEAYKSELKKESVVKLLQISDQIQTDAYEIQSMVNQLQELLVDVLKDPNNKLLPLGIEYMNIFRGAGPNPVYLYEAVQRSVEGLIFEEPYFEVKACYEKSGFASDLDWTDPEDHISIECSFLAFLSDRITQAQINCEFDQAAILQKQRNDFLRQHFLQWVPRFSEQVIHNTSHDFYRHIGLLTQTVCNQISFNFQPLTVN
jgi:anaerobic dimethyl sulfoxide reductase subunit A